MAKKQDDLTLFNRARRLKPSLSFESPSQELLVEPGKAQSVQKLYQDFVLGRLDPSQIGGMPQFDPEGSSEVDPFNNFALTLEQADALRQQSEQQVRSARKNGKKTVANAAADATHANEATNKPQEGGTNVVE